MNDYEKIAILEKKLESLEAEICKKDDIILRNDEVVKTAEKLCVELASTKIYKLAHFLTRTKHQCLFGSWTEKRKYLNWICRKIIFGKGDLDYRYNPLYGIINVLKQRKIYYKTNNNFHNVDDLRTNNKYLYKHYSKFDIIILSVIDYDFRFQRPQQFAKRFAENGHRVFYINANFHESENIDVRAENLFVINLHSDKNDNIYSTDLKDEQGEIYRKITDILNNYCIKDAITIVDYPNWINLAIFLRNRYGFKILTDYMDDYTGFLNDEVEMLKDNCVKLLRVSDSVIASSQFLYDIAIKYNKNVDIIRNGTEYKHFNRAYEQQSGDRVIGYYGAIANWFDYQKVICLSERFCDKDILIIGECTNHEVEMSQRSNIKLIGEISYDILPEYLKKIDVCLIPFDTSTDLIKATNPVKFYEYLSAGKKIVATEIPELEPYRDRYVYLTNDNNKFVEYVGLCLEGKDALADAEECMNFAKENDWENRFLEFKKRCENTVPKVSIVVLTYNNLELNKICINSILDNTAYPNFELIIVDNDSNDGTKEYLSIIEKKYSKVKVFFNEKNIGFAAGNNIGIKEAQGNYVVLLNNDTIVTKGWLTAMVKHMENDSTIGMCGPVTNSIGNEAKIEVDYTDIDGLRIFANLYTSKNLNKTFENVRYLALFCTVIRREILDSYGVLDEQYGIGMFEDDDYSEVVKRNGYKIVIAEDAFIHHFAGASFKKLEDKEYRKIFDENKAKFENKWSVKWEMPKYRAGVYADTNLHIDLLKHISNKSSV